MNLNNLIKKINNISDKYSQKYHIARDRLWYLLKLQEEMGELTQCYLSLSGKGRLKKTQSELRKELEHEIADVLCHVLLFASSEKVDVKKAIAEKWLSQL